MPREIITIQVGQAGNQIGCRFWDLALREHAAFNPSGIYDDPISSFFRNVDTRYAEPRDIPIGDGTRPISALRARAVLVDSEEGVVGQLLRGHLAEVFDRSLLVTDVSGAGNNWAHGHSVYGPAHHDRFLEAVRRASESCDSLQCFSLIHSLGGGTGSGLGTYLLRALHDEYPKQLRFATSVFPSADDDVITSPYNATLATAELINHADAIFPVDNEVRVHAHVLGMWTFACQPRGRSSLAGSEVHAHAHFLLAFACPNSRPYQCPRPCPHLPASVGTLLQALAELATRAQTRPVNAGEGPREATLADNAVNMK